MDAKAPDLADASQDRKGKWSSGEEDFAGAYSPTMRASHFLKEPSGLLRLY